MAASRVPLASIEVGVMSTVKRHQAEFALRASFGGAVGGSCRSHRAAVCKSETWIPRDPAGRITRKTLNVRRLPIVIAP